jgi:hypothetical protein
VGASKLLRTGSPIKWNLELMRIAGHPMEGLELPHNCGHLGCVVGALLEGRWTDASKMAVTPSLIVEDLNIVEDISACILA